MALSEEEQQLLASRMRLEQYRRDEVLFTRGDPSRALYLIQSGWVKLIAERGGVVANLGPGSLVGESDLFGGRARTLEARATADVELLALSGYNLESLIASNPGLGLSLSVAFGARVVQLRTFLVEQRLKKLSFLVSLGEVELYALADRLAPREVRKAAFVFQAGQQPRSMFVLESGSMRLVDGAAPDQDFVDLKPGDAFGEMALLMGTAYPSSAYATEDSIVWELSGADFEELTTTQPAIRSVLSRGLRERLGPQERQTALEMLRAIQLFAGLPAQILSGIVNRLIIRHVPEGEPIYSEGERGDAFYVIRSGEVQIYSGNGAEIVESARLSPGEAFGETALLTGKSRSHAARALVNANLFVLSRADFDELLVQFPSLSMALTRTLSRRLHEADQTFVDSHLGRMPILSGFSRSQLQDIGDRVRPIRYRAGELIFAQDTPGEVMYFIESGQVRIAARKGQKLTTLAILGRGEFFGEMALLTGNLRCALAQAVSDVDLWALQQKDLDELMHRFPQLAIGIGRVLSQRLSKTSEAMAEGGVAPRRAASQVAAPAAETRKAIPARAAGGQADRAAKPSRVTRVKAGPGKKSAGEDDGKGKVAGNGKESGSGGEGKPRLRENIVEGMGNAGAWFARCSIATKLQIVGVLLLMVWLCGISAPATVIGAFSNNDVRLRNMAFLQTVTPIPTDTPIPTPTSTITPTPTQTPTPTDTPTPTATFTSVPPTSTPEPTSTPRPAPREVPPTDTPAPEVPTATPPPAVDFKLVKVRRLTACENKGGHNIYVNVLDKDGNGLPGVPVWVSWGPDGTELMSGTKPERGTGATDFPMFKGTHTVEIRGAKSEVATGITPDIPVDEPCEDVGTANSLYHYSYEVVFQRTW